MKKITSLADYISRSDKWSNELNTLRDILAGTGLNETVKWGAPCYIYKGKNIVGMAAFNDYFGLWFHQGALLKDTHSKLINAQEGKTKALRQWRMQRASDIKPTIIRRYVAESVANVDSGREIKPTRKAALSIPDQLREALEKSVVTRRGFDQLTPARQREYAEYIAEAKRAETKARRIQKIIPMIRKGQGLNDRYR